jgi:hypothetical protein
VYFTPNGLSLRKYAVFNINQINSDSSNCHQLIIDQGYESARAAVARFSSKEQAPLTSADVILASGTPFSLLPLFSCLLC